MKEVEIESNRNATFRSKVDVLNKGKESKTEEFV